MTTEIVSETWRDVAGWPGYQVSDHGRARSFWRTISVGKCGWRWVISDTAKIIGSRICPPKKYQRVSLRGNSRNKQNLIQALVLEAFVGPRPKGMMALHKDDDESNNHVSNLYWGTRQDNSNDAVRNGKQPKGERHWNSKLTDQQVGEIRRRVLAGERGVRLAEEFGISSPTITAIKKGIRSKHLCEDAS